MTLRRKTPLRNKRPIPRGSSTLQRSAPIPRVNRQRKASEFARCYGSRARVAFIRRLPCAACGTTRWGCDNAHTENDGAGRKGDFTTIIPLCSGLNGCHATQHRAGWLAIGMTAESRRRAALATELAWQARGMHDLEDAA